MDNHFIVRYTASYKPFHKKTSVEEIFEITLEKDDWKFLSGNKVNGKYFIPMSVYLKIVWNILQIIKKKPDFSVIFEDVKIYKCFVEITRKGSLTLKVMISKGIPSDQI